MSHTFSRPPATSLPGTESAETADRDHRVRESHAPDHRELACAAVMAPSPDNNQPWRFVSTKGALFIHLDPSRALPSDVNAMCDLTGVGCAVENACLAAQQQGCLPRVEYPPVADWARVMSGLAPAATMAFSPGGEPDCLFGHVPDRCTCRAFYSKRPIPAELLNRLAHTVDQFPEVQLDWLADRPRIRAFARLVGATDRIRFEYEPFHNEVFKQLRFSPQHAEETRDGLDVRTLALPPGAAMLLRMLRPWKRMQWIHRLGLGRLLSLPSVWSVRRSGAIGIVSLPEATPAGFLVGGRAFQRIWLSACSEGLAFQPLGSIAVFFAHLQQLDGQRMSARHQRQLQTLICRCGQLVPTMHGRTIQVAFRLGYASRPVVRALRRPVDEVLASINP